MADGEVEDTTVAEVVNSSEWKKCIDTVARAVVVLKASPQRRPDVLSRGKAKWLATSFE